MIKYLHLIIKIAITGEGVCAEVLRDADWQKLYELACKQGVACVAWHGIEVLYQYDVNLCPTELKLAWYARCQQVEAANKKKLGRIAAFAEEIRPLQIAVLKGVDYARFWPNAEWREFGDLDCYEVGGNSLEIDKKAREIGCKVVDDDYKHTQIYYKDLMVENHHCFTGFAGSREGKVLEWELRKLFSIDNLESRFDNCPLLTPNREFTAVFMVAHAHNHLFYEGLSLRQILDWHFFLMKEAGNVDWVRVKEVWERTRLMPFAVLLTVFCKKHFGLEPQTTPICTDGVDARLLEMFENDLFAEKYNDHDRRWHMMIARMLHRYKRMYKFRSLMRMPICKAIWRTIAYSSFLHRKPRLE